MKYDYLIVGAGFAGSVMAERLASQLNKKILIVEMLITSLCSLFYVRKIWEQ